MVFEHRTIAAPAVVGLAVLAVAAPSAGAAEIKTLPCVPFNRGEATMPIAGTGFTPGGRVALSTSTAASPALVPLTASSADAGGAFGALTLPPSLANSDTHLQAFNLIAADTSNPAAPILAASPFQVVRFGTTRSSEPRRPSQKVTYTARGFVPGKPIYIHFRFAGVTRRTVKLGVASAPCGIASERMRALPTRPRGGTWTAYTDQARRYSRNTRPQWRDRFVIFRRFE